jgi:hypothetical protein
MGWCTLVGGVVAQATRKNAPNRTNLCFMAFPGKGRKSFSNLRTSLFAGSENGDVGKLSPSYGDGNRSGWFLDFKRWWSGYAEGGE